jgi:CubicO group peptidase (beta-lactamase class C family)
MLCDQGLLKLNDPVSKYIPSFDREWEVVTVHAEGESTVEYTSFMNGETNHITYTAAPATSTMTIKHLMSESAGTVRAFRQEFPLGDAVGSHTCSLEASMHVTNGIPLGCSLLLLVGTVNCVRTLQA